MPMKPGYAGSAQQLHDGKLVVKLFLRHPLHAKLYLLFRQDVHTPIIGYMGSSNLTFSGLSGQGELNLDVLEQDAAKKLTQWFEDRWLKQLVCRHLSRNWSKSSKKVGQGKSSPPLLHLPQDGLPFSREARAGLNGIFSIPREFGNQLFDFQTAAVKIAARHLNQRRWGAHWRCSRSGQNHHGHRLGQNL